LALLIAVFFPILLIGLATQMKSASAANNGTPVLVELFTSEGCSSCPPADRLLQKLDADGASGAQVIALSEHVDYWNQLGWKDPYSSSFFSERQSAYGDRFGLASVYTPQMVVSGTAQFTGSDSHAATKAIADAAGMQKYTVKISDVSVDGSGALHAHVSVSPNGDPSGTAELYCAIALNHAESQVTRGENEGNRLTHVAVVASLQKAGDVHPGKSFDQDLTFHLKSGMDPANLRLVAFIQQPHSGPVLGAAMQQVK
jgi:hypothetical protein